MMNYEDMRRQGSYMNGNNVNNILEYGNGFPYSANKGMMKMNNYSNYNKANAIYQIMDINKILIVGSLLSCFNKILYIVKIC